MIDRHLTMVGFKETMQLVWWKACICEIFGLKISNDRLPERILLYLPCASVFSQYTLN